jgi:hypothetical protein
MTSCVITAAISTSKASQPSTVDQRDDAVTGRACCRIACRRSEGRKYRRAGIRASLQASAASAGASARHAQKATMLTNVANGAVQEGAQGMQALSCSVE